MHMNLKIPALVTSQQLDDIAMTQITFASASANSDKGLVFELV